MPPRLCSGHSTTGGPEVLKGASSQSEAFLAQGRCRGRGRGRGRARGGSAAQPYREVMSEAQETPPQP